MPDIQLFGKPVATQPVPNIGSQIERALLAYLKTAYGDAAEVINFYFSNDWKQRQAPAVDALAHKSTETVPHTRNESYVVRLEWIWNGNNQAGQSNPDSNWQEINNFVGVGMAALSVSDTGEPDRVPVITAADITKAAQALAAAEPETHGDLATFVCEFIGYKGAQRAEAVDGTFFIKEIRHFEVRGGNQAQ